MGKLKNALIELDDLFGRGRVDQERLLSYYDAEKDRFDLDRLVNDVLDGNCPECGGARQIEIDDPYLGKIVSGCDVCWWVDEEVENRLAENDAQQRQGSYEDECLGGEW